MQADFSFAAAQGPKPCGDRPVWSFRSARNILYQQGMNQTSTLSSQLSLPIKEMETASAKLPDNTVAQPFTGASPVSQADETVPAAVATSPGQLPTPSTQAGGGVRKDNSLCQPVKPSKAPVERKACHSQRSASRSSRYVLRPESLEKHAYILFCFYIDTVARYCAKALNKVLKRTALNACWSRLASASHRPVQTC